MAGAQGQPDQYLGDLLRVGLVAVFIAQVEGPVSLGPCGLTRVGAWHENHASALLVEAAEELVFGSLALSDLGTYEVYELVFAVFDGEVFYRWGGVFSGPGGLPGGPVPI